MSRQSHFTVGSNPTNPFITTAQTSFNNQPKEVKQFPNINQANIEKDTNENKQALRATHFQLGDYQAKDFYQTTNQHMFVKHVDGESAALSEEKKKDLRTHHFNMGTYGIATKTINNLTYDQKQISSNLQADQDKQRAKMRAHHHDFREEPDFPLRTKYNDDYSKYKPDVQQAEATKNQIQQKVEELRNSHIILGREQIPYQTIQQQDYNSKYGIVANAQKVNFQGTHFELGIQKDSMQTTNDIYHKQQPIIKAALNAELQADLKASHWRLGDQGENYKTEAKSNYQFDKNKVNPSHAKDPKLWSSHYSIGNQYGPTDIYNTTYKDAMKQPERQNADQARDQTADRGSHFQLGNQGKFYQSEFKSHFNNPNGEPSSLNQGLKQQLRSSHFAFNDVAQNNYSTTAKDSYTNQNQAKVNKLDPQQEENLRAHHFGFGQSKLQYSTQMKDTHTHMGDAKPNNLNKALAQDLRTHHFKFA